MTGDVTNRTALDDVLGHLPTESRERYARIVGRYGIAENSAEVIGVALIIEALSPVVTDMIAAVEAERARIETASATLPETMRAAAVPIVESLGDEIAERTVVAVREDARRAVVDVLASGMEAHAGSMDVLVSEHAASTKALTSAASKAASEASSAVQRIEARSMETASVLVRQAMAVTGWSLFRWSAIGLGALAVVAAFAFGVFGRTADDVLQCSVRVQHVAAISRWSPHETNDVRRAVCDSVGRGGGASWLN